MKRKIWEGIEILLFTLMRDSQIASHERITARQMRVAHHGSINVTQMMVFIAWRMTATVMRAAKEKKLKRI